MAVEPRVVVLVQTRIGPSDVPGRYFAEIRELGLGVHGTTPSESLEKIKLMFTSAVQARRKLGKLAQWLDRSGLEWQWEPDYQRGIPITKADDRLPAAATAARELVMTG